MGSQELNLELQQRLSDLTVKAREYFQNGNYLEFEKIQYEKWNLIPDPKENWEESYRVSKVFIALYLNYNIDFDKANKWLEMLIKLDKVQQQHPGEVSLVTGKMQFEKALFKEAYQSFNNAFILSEGHCFGIGDENSKSKGINIIANTK